MRGTSVAAQQLVWNCSSILQNTPCAGQFFSHGRKFFCAMFRLVTVKISDIYVPNTDFRLYVASAKTCPMRQCAPLAKVLLNMNSIGPAQT